MSGSTWHVGFKLVLCRSFQGFLFFHSVHKLFWVFLQGMIKTIRALSWHGHHLAHSGYRFPLVTAIECIFTDFILSPVYCSLLLMSGFHNHWPIYTLNSCPEASLPSVADYTLFFFSTRHWKILTNIYLTWTSHVLVVSLLVKFRVMGENFNVFLKLYIKSIAIKPQPSMVLRKCM